MIFVSLFTAITGNMLLFHIGDDGGGRYVLEVFATQLVDHSAGILGAGLLYNSR